MVAPRVSTARHFQYFANIIQLTFLHLSRFNDSFLAHSRLDDNMDAILLVEQLGQLLSSLSPRNLHIVRGLSDLDVEEAQKPIAGDIKQQVFLLADEGNLNITVARRDMVVLFAREDVAGDDVDLGVAVLSGFGNGEVGDLARVGLVENDVATFAEGGGLGWVGEGGARVCCLEGVFFRIFFCRHFWSSSASTAIISGLVFAGIMRGRRW